MVKILVSLLLAIMLVGCSDQPVKIVYQTKEVPIYVVPKPPVVAQPILAITLLTPEQKTKIGELSKAYNISLKQSMQYACQLKNIVDEYAILSQNTPTLISPVPMSLSLAVPSISDILSKINPKTFILAVPDTVTKDCNK